MYVVQLGFLSNSVYREYPLQAATLKLRQQLLQLVADNPNGLPSLDPMKDLKINDMGYVDMYEEKKSFESAVMSYKCIQCPQFNQHVCHYCIFTLVQ